jgi:isocitrate dehydrogenase kinase/phosphatase
MTDPSLIRAAGRGAEIILKGFERYHRSFIEISRRASSRFVNRDWQGIQRDAVERLDLYNRVVMDGVRKLQELGAGSKDKNLWAVMKDQYSVLLVGRDDSELAETFFNSTTRRIFTTVGVDPLIEYVDSNIKDNTENSAAPVYRTYSHQSSMEALFVQLFQQVFQDYPLESYFENLKQNIQLAAQKVDEHLELLGVTGCQGTVDIIKPVFFRGKGAYIIGRVRYEKMTFPLVFCIRSHQEGLIIDAILLNEKDVSILFSFTRSYFMIDASCPQQLVSFLKTIIPGKKVAELYTSLGYNKHGKTELYRDLLSHLTQSDDQFQTARGEKGMVMLVFTLNSYDLVFKVIRDRFLEPKASNRQDVIDRYQLVFKHDRAGRLIDAQEFEYLRFEKSRFHPSLLEELLAGAPGSVSVEGDFVSIRHLYTERRLIPLNIYLREAPVESAREVVLDYGSAIKDLAATNIFPGDILLKNFGVTRHKRVVFYDYDELSLLDSCKFRSIPSAQRFADDFEAEPWFYIGPDDIFPQEFETFLGLQGELRDVFFEAHKDLFEVEFWRTMQARIRSGEIVDIFPYHQNQRLHQSDSKSWE